jgi:hypothetical protein
MPTKTFNIPNSCSPFLTELLPGGTRLPLKRAAGSVAANIDYSLVSDLSYFFLQLRIGPTDLFMVVPRNDAIFLKLHTNRY